MFEEGSLKIRETQYTDYPDYDVSKPLAEKKINNENYRKRNVKYMDVVKEYSKIFTGDALNKLLNKRFAEVDGYLYVSDGGATGWNIANVSVSRIGQPNDEIRYSVKYNDVLIGDSYSEQKTCEMTLKYVDGDYRILSTNYCNL